MKRLTSIIAMFVVLLLIGACSKITKPEAEADIEKISHPSSTGDKGMGDVAAPTEPQKSDTPYDGDVADKKVEGSVEFDTIKSDYECETASDCTSTKFANIPKDQSECTCQAACTPYVVNEMTRRKRKSANMKLCGPREWFGTHCPAPECSFMEFESFECVDKKCVGVAEGKR